MGARRGHGEGSISKRTDGRWMARVDLGYVNGKRKRKYVYGKTRKEVADQLKSLLHQQQQGINIAPDRQTVAQYLEHWLKDIVAPRCRPTTQEIYAASVRRIVKFIGNIQLAKLTPQHVQAMLNDLLAEGYKPATVDRARDVLINALNQAVKWDLMPRNVATLTDPPKVEAYRPKVFTPVQAQQFLAVTVGDRFEVAYWLGLLGLRRGEVLGLRWPEIDLEEGVLYVRWGLEPIRRDLYTDAQREARGIHQLTDTLTLVKPKTEESERTVHLPKSVIALLRQHRIQQLQDRLLAGEQWQDHDLVFCGRIGTPIVPRNFLRERQALLRRAGIPNIRFHDLRHSFVSLMIAAGVPLKVVQELAGHSDPRITQQIYTHVTEDQKREAASIMDTLLSGALQNVG